MVIVFSGVQKLRHEGLDLPVLFLFLLVQQILFALPEVNSHWLASEWVGAVKKTNGVLGFLDFFE